MSDDPMNIGKVMGDLNPHIPVARRPLSDYIDSKDLTYRTKGGNTCVMERSEIDLLSENCTESDRMRLRLPIFVLTDVSDSDGAWKVEGKVESRIIAKILGRVQFKEDVVRFYNPDLIKLRKTLPNSVVVLFVL